MLAMLQPARKCGAQDPCRSDQPEGRGSQETHRARRAGGRPRRQHRRQGRGPPPGRRGPVRDRRGTGARRSDRRRGQGALRARERHDDDPAGGSRGCSGDSAAAAGQDQRQSRRRRQGRTAPARGRDPLDDPQAPAGWRLRFTMTRSNRLPNCGERKSMAPSRTELALYVFLGVVFSAPVAASTPQPLSIRILPQEPTLSGAKASQQLIVLGKYADGRERDVTSDCQFSVANPQLAEVAKTGMKAKILGRADGETVLTVGLGNRVAETKIRIERSQEGRPFSFARDVGRILTRRGCNNTDCHGSVIGRGGLKLSFDMVDPGEDHRWIVQGGIYSVLTVEPKGPKPPRIDLKQPEKSLLLLKPTMSVAHVGGQLFGPDSSDYAMIRDWVRQGAPYGVDPASDKVRIEQLEVSPTEVLLDVGGKQQVVVTAHFSDGRREDVTEQVRYAAKNGAVAETGDDGVVKAVKPGETTVLIHLAGCEPTGIWVGVVAKPAGNYPAITGRNIIDDHVFAKLRKLGIRPSEQSGDAEFLRRVCLDVAGTLPPPERVREFLASKDPRKRDKLIETLVNSPEQVDYWTYRFA
ncbi:MAG: DUF1549 domain-containing protein, partial [Betaproteobacteria bacterium]|nr:DUF1549 domain-containing protein [Betaproteobacteria bacterium]